ncbi:MAG: choice-of-anchor L domain-containing protein, partial [Flavobacterium sp.]
MKRILLLLLLVSLQNVFSQANIKVVNTNLQEFYVPGSTATYSITIVNLGPQNATNLVVNNPIPAGITNFQWTGSNGSNGFNVNLNNNLGTLNVGATASYTVVLEIPLNFTGNLQSQTNVTSTNPNVVVNCTECIDLDTPPPGADLVVVNTNNQDFYTPGTTVTYNISVTNFGPLSSAAVTVFNAIPAGITSFVWSGSNGSSGFNVPLNNLVGTMEAQQSVTYTITMQIPLNFTGNLISQTVVNSPTVDQNPACAQCIDTDVIASANIEVVNTNNTNVYVPGLPSVYTVTVTNNGPTDAYNVQVNNLIPAGITQFSWVGDNGTSGNNVPLADLIPLLLNGESVVYTITIQVPNNFTGNLTSTTTINTPTPDPVPGCTGCVDTDTLAVGADLLITTTNNQVGYLPGSTLVYNITVTNQGPNAATNVLISNIVQAGLNSFSWVGSNGSSGLNTNINEIIPSIAVGETVTFTLTVNVPVDFVNNIVMETTAVADQADPNLLCSACIDTDEALPVADLDVVNTNNQIAYIPGGTSTYTITLTNNGPFDAQNVIVFNDIPAGVTNFTWSGNGAGDVDVPLDDFIATLPVGQSIVYTISFDIPLTQTGDLTSIFSYSSDTPDPDANCTGCVDVDVLGVGADLVVVNTNNQNTYTPGSLSNYTITVTNNGPQAAANVNVLNQIPAGISIFSWTGSNGTNGVDVNLDDTIALLAVGETITYNITLEVPLTFVGDLQSETIATSTTPDPNPNCNTCVDVDILESADLVVVNTNNQDFYFPGTTASYTFTVTNNGPTEANNVSVGYVFPPEMTNFSWVGNGTNGTNTLVNTIINLQVGETVTYQVSFDIPANFNGPLTTTAEVSSVATDPNPACPQCDDTDLPQSGANLVVTQTDGVGFYTAGQNTTYTITVTNIGPEIATNVNISDVVPTGIPVNNFSWNFNNGAQVGTGNFNTNLTQLLVNQSVTLTVIISVPASFDQNTNLVNQVVVTSDTPDPIPGCNQCIDTNEPAPLANLIVVKTDNQTTYINDSEVTYTITIVNNGPSNAENVLVQEVLPTGITQMNWSNSLGDFGSGTLAQTLPSVAVGQLITYQVTIQVPNNFSGGANTINLINTVTITSDTPDPVPACPLCTDTNTPRPRHITISTQNDPSPGLFQYTVQQLVENVLIDSDCANVSNFTSSANCGIGYFNANNSNFQFDAGMVLRCGNVVQTQGHYAGNENSSVCSGTGDAELLAISQANGQFSTINDVTFVKFNFTPLTNNFSFNFIFASNEYGQFQCNFADVFAFILTDLVTNVSTNIAVIPGTTTPVSVLNIRDNAFNAGCASVNPDLFDTFNPDIPANQTSFNMIGYTVPLTASATVIPNNPYSIKLVIGDYQDSILDSAVFIEAGSFNVGTANIEGTGPFAGLPIDYTIAENTALCDGDCRMIQAGSSPIAGANYQWEQNGVVIDGATTFDLEVCEEGEYTVIVSIGDNTDGCLQTDSILVEFYPAPALGEPENIVSCTEFFDLTTQEVEMANGNVVDFVTYHETLQDAIDGFPLIDDPFNYVGTNGQTIYASLFIQDANCPNILSFQIFTETCNFDYPSPAPLALCDDVTNDGFEIFNFTVIDVIADNDLDPNTNVVSYHNSEDDATNNVNPILNFTNYNGTNETIFIRVQNTENPDVYGLTSFDLIVIPLPTPPTLEDVTVCDAYILPNLQGENLIINADFSQGNAAFTTNYIFHTPVNPNTSQGVYGIVNNSQTWFNLFGNCTDHTTGNGLMMVVDGSITNGGNDKIWCQTVAVEPNQDYTFSYWIQTVALPNPANIQVRINGVVVGANLAPNSLCNWIQHTYTWNAGNQTSAEICLYDTVLIANGNDFALDDFSFTQNTIPFYTGTQASGQVFQSGDAVTQTTTFFIYEETDTTPNCWQETSFTVTVNNTPAINTFENVVVCDQYILPELTIGGNYFTAPNGGGTQLAVGDVISTTQTLYVYAETDTNPNCFSQDVFTVTVNITPQVVDLADVVVCDSYTLPALAVGNYRTAANGGGVVLNAGTQITSTQTIFIYAATNTTPNCFTESSFTVTINQTPNVPELEDVFLCASDGGYILPILTVGNYFTAPNGGGVQLNAGDLITSSQVIYIYAQTGTTPNCTDQSSFEVTISSVP